MLRTRIVTALFIAPLAFALIFAAGAGTFGLVLTALLLIGSWEFKKLGGMAHGVSGWLMMGVQAVLFFLLYRYSESLFLHPSAFLTMGCLVWLLMFVRLIVFRPDAAVDFHYRMVSFVSSLGTLTIAWLSLYWLRNEAAGSWWVLLLLLVIWATDIGAYFAGRTFGKRKLAARISPAKTIAGFFGGLLSAVLVSLLAVHFIPQIELGPGQLIPLVLMTSLVSVGGDLFISLHKRISGCKDAGGLFPGHGGVLDRIDSLLAGAPFFALGKHFLSL